MEFVHLLAAHRRVSYLLHGFRQLHRQITRSPNAAILIADGFVQKADERRDLTEHAEDAAVEAGFGRKARGELTTGEELPVLQVLGSLVILREAPRHSLEPF